MYYCNTEQPKKCKSKTDDQADSDFVQFFKKQPCVPKCIFILPKKGNKSVSKKNELSAQTLHAISIYFNPS